MKERIKHNNALYIFLPLIAIAVLRMVDKTSVFSYGYTLLIFFAFHLVHFENKEVDRNFIYLHYYLAHAILLFCVFRYQMPEYMGLTGPEGGIGTDDVRFYAQVVQGKGVFYHIKVSLVNIHHFSSLLLIVYPFEVHTPLNLVTFNLVGVCFLPYYMKKLTLEIFDDEKLANRVGLLTLLCPFLTYYGCILMRDTLIVTLVVGGMYYFMRRKYIPMLLFAALIIWVRFGSFIYFITGILLIMRRNLMVANKSTIRLTLLIIVLIIIFNYSYETIQEFSEGKLGDSVFRSTESDFFEDTTISKLTKLRFPLNIIALTVFFLVNPMFGWRGLSEGITHEIYLMSNIYSATLNGLFMLVLWPFIFNGILAWFNRRSVNLQLAILLMFGFTIVLGVVDLQIRHKVIVYPFICMVAAYGMVRYDHLSKYWSTVLGGLMIAAQLALFVIRVFLPFHNPFA